MALKQKVDNFKHNAPQLIEGTAKGQSIGQGMEALMGGFILAIVGIYLVSEGREVLNSSEADDLESVDVALFGVVFIVLVAGIALYAWKSIT